MSTFDRLIAAREKRIVPSWRITTTLLVVWLGGWVGELLYVRVGWWWAIIPAVVVSAAVELLLGQFRRVR